MCCQVFTCQNVTCVAEETPFLSLYLRASLPSIVAIDTRVSHSFPSFYPESDSGLAMFAHHVICGRAPLAQFTLMINYLHLLQPVLPIREVTMTRGPRALE